MGEEYAEKLAGESAYWDNYMAQRLLLGEIPGSIDFRLFFTQLRHRYDWAPPTLGGVEVNFRRQEINYILTTAVSRRGVRVLDLGCGAGWLSLELARRGAHVTALDISPTNLALGRYMAETNSRNFPFLYQKFAGLPCALLDFGSIEYINADLNSIDLPAQEYDAVVVWDSLHHIANLDRLLGQVRNSLKPGGVFVGVDHAYATERTEAFNRLLLPWLDDLSGWVSREDPAWLYDGVRNLAERRDWGVLTVDYNAKPVGGSEAFFEQLRAELLKIVRSGLRQEAQGKAAAQIEASPTGTPTNASSEEVSPFEDVSAHAVMQTLAGHFSVAQLTTICPFIQPERHLPGYDAVALHFRSEKEAIFQHYLACALIQVGERAISRGQADGQWFLFHLTPGEPEQRSEANSFLGTPAIAAPEHDEVEALQQLVAGQSAELAERLAYIRHVEAELERKNAALGRVEATLQQREEALTRARAPRLPWKRAKR